MIILHTEAKWHDDLKEKSLLKYINPYSLKVGKTHSVWSTVRNSIIDNKRAQLKCKVLTGTYTLRGNRAAFNQYTNDATCNIATFYSRMLSYYIPMKGKHMSRN